MDDKPETTQEQRGWGWLPLFLLGLAAILFLTSTIHALREERILHRLNHRLDRMIEKNDKAIKGLKRTHDSVQNDPQTKFRHLDPRREEEDQESRP